MDKPNTTHADLLEMLTGVKTRIAWAGGTTEAKALGVDFAAAVVHALQTEQRTRLYTNRIEAVEMYSAELEALAKGARVVEGKELIIKKIREQKKVKRDSEAEIERLRTLARRCYS